jgi:uncharacterized membrane protein YfcA
MVVAAMLVGVAKTGIAGLSLLFVSMFASVIPARRSTGLVVPLLIIGDLVAYFSYRRHAQWRHIWRLLPWTAVGMAAGYVALGRMDDHQARNAIGFVILGLAALHVYWRFGPKPEAREHGIWFVALIGVLIGFTTIISNSSGPLMVIYLLTTRLPKMEYVGTMAVFFLLLNILKLPLMVSLGLITRDGLWVNLALAPAVLAGTWLGRWLLGRINQKAFENIALVLTLLAGAKMLL